MTDAWLLRAIREQIDRELIGELVQRRTGAAADVRLVQHSDDERNPYNPLEEW